jgi:hypothetical protein
MAWTTPRTWSAGETLTAANFNTHIRDNELALGPHLIARKATDESVTSSAALQADNDLLVNIPANEVWFLQWRLRFEGSTTGDINLRWTFQAGGEVNFNGMYRDTAGVLTEAHIFDNSSPTGGEDIACDGAGSRIFVAFEGLYLQGGTGGNVVLEWAQNTSDGTATIMKANSTLWGVKLA